MENINVTNRIFSDILLGDKEANVESLVNYVRTKFELNDEKIDVVRDRLCRYFMPAFEKRRKAAFYRNNIFQKNNTAWLHSYFTVNLETKRCGRRSRDDFDECSKSTKQRKINLIREQYSKTEIERAFLQNLRDSDKMKLANMITDLLLKPDDVIENVKNNEIIRFSETEAVALIEDVKLSKYQYETIRSQIKQRNADILVPYKQLSFAKQQCYPAEAAFSITETGAKIKLQALLDHTASRILQVQNVSVDFQKEQSVSLRLITKWGCDEASDQQQYKQKFPDDCISDESIFMVSMVPICLKSESSVLWNNPHPASPRYCRPIEFEYAKESSDKTRAKVRSLQDEIDHLEPTSITINGVNCLVYHKMLLTMVDGKVCQTLSNTASASTCYICGANPSQMNNLDQVRQKHEIVANFQFGLPTLHAWIRFMECLLHIAYRLQFKKWTARTLEEKDQMKNAKQRIQRGFKEHMGLIIDVTWFWNIERRQHCT